jgi:photosystem II stability/assembly factor-like uncharacterized protein
MPTGKVDNALKSSKSALFVQPNGPNTRPRYIGCKDLEDIVEALGAVELLRCFKPDGSGTWDTVGSTQAPPDPVTTTIAGLMDKTADWLEKVRCPATLFVNMTECGRVDDFTNYVRTFSLNLAKITNKTLSQLVRREEDLPALQSFEFAADPPVLRLWEMRAARQSISSDEDLHDIAFCNDEKCADSCGVAQDICDDGIIGAATSAGSPAGTSAVLETNNSGADGWPAVAADPFAAGEDIMSVVCFPMSPTVTRWLAVRDADAANPLEVAYSDDGGATWTLVVVGALNNQEAMGPGALYAIDRFNIWLAASDGYIYFSDDGGVTWTTQEAGTITANDLHAIWAADEDSVMAVGVTDTVLFSLDGGSTWTAATATGGGNTNLTVNWSFGFWWIGDNGGELHFSEDDGTTWTDRTEFPAFGVGDIPDVQFVNELCGYLISNTAAPVGTIYRTRDGGFNWEAITPAVTNAGLNAIWSCDCNMVFAVGDVQGGTGVVLKAIGSIHA